MTRYYTRTPRTDALKAKVEALERALLEGRISANEARLGFAGAVTVARDSFRLAPAEPADPLTLRHPGGDIIAVFDGDVVLKEGFNYTVDKEAGTVTLKFLPRFDVRFLVGG